jgi:hypothetical protein
MMEVIDAVIKIQTGPCRSKLGQYRNEATSAMLAGTLLSTPPIRNSPVDPPNPFTDPAVQTFTGNVAIDYQPSKGQRVLHCVVMPPGVRYNDPPYAGAYSYIIDPFAIFSNYTWAMNGGTLDSVTDIFSEVLVETATDLPLGMVFR